MAKPLKKIYNKNMSDHRTQAEHERKGPEKTQVTPKGPQNGTENLENSEIRNVISEITSETATEDTGGIGDQTAAQIASQAQRAAFEQKKKELIASQPPAPQMVQEISTTLQHEKKQLKAEEKKFRRSADLNNLGKIVARLREINEIVDTIAHATYEILKKIWLKVVHGIV